MSKPAPRMQSGCPPEQGAKIALLTTKGIIGGVLTSWSDGGAVVEACGEVVPGEKVRLRAQGPDKIWEKNATILWVKDQSFALEFDPDGPARKGGFSAIPRIRQFLYSMRSPTRPATEHSAIVEGKRSELQLPGEDIQDRRSHRRLRFETGAQIMWVDSALEQDTARITDASRSGVRFTTNRAYPVGTILQVQYPYPNSTSPKRQGNVVRVEMLPNGRRSVAVAFGSD